MRFAVLVKASKESEAGVLPTREEFAEMTKFNERLVKDGVMLAGDGLHATSKGVRLRFDGGRTTVIDGPFAETKEQLLGFFIIDVANLEEALDIARELVAANTGSTYEIRPIALYFGDQRHSSAA